MGQHLSYRSKNPALNSKIFNESLTRDLSDVMTIQGTVDKTAIALSILLVAGYFGYTSFSPVIMFGGFIGGFIVAIVTIYKRTWAPYTVPIYAVLEGLALGGISFFIILYTKGLFYRL